MAPRRAHWVIPCWAKPAPAASRRVRRRSRGAGGEQAWRLRADNVEKHGEVTFMTPTHDAHWSRRMLRRIPARWRSRQRVEVVALALSWGVAVIPSLQAQKASPTEYEVKAAYLYNFGRFVQWPNKSTAHGGSPFTVCVLGQDPFGQALDAILAGESIDGANTAAARISKPQEPVNCRILFISSSEASHLNQILLTSESRLLLTVSDLPLFSQRGGMVQFVLEGKRVRFEVNLTPVEHTHLALSSQLLQVAVNFRRSDRLGD